MMSGRDRDRDRGRGMDSGPDKTDSDWRARPSSDQDDGPRRDDGFGDSKSDRCTVYVMLAQIVFIGFRMSNIDIKLT